MSVQKVLEVAFDRKPADYRNNYIPSYANDRRYTLRNSGILKEKRVATNENLPSWLQKGMIGEFEKDMLWSILNSHDSVIAYRSGTGSGKSSAVRAMRKFCSDISEASVIHPKLPLKNFFCVADTQSATSYSIDADPPPIIDNEYVSGFFSYVADECLAVLLKIANPVDIRSIINRLINGSEMGHEGCVFEFSEYLRSARIDFSETSFADFVNELRRFSRSLSGRDRFDFVIRVFIIVGCIFREVGRSFVLAFDNTDRLKKTLLRALLTEVNAISARIPQYRSSLKICVFMRLSTSNDHLNAIPVSYSEYLSPDPIDIVISRGLSFLSRKKNDALYSGFSADDLSTADGLVTELLLNIIDHNPEFQSILRSLSGTNIRNTFDQVIKWCDQDSRTPVEPRVSSRADLNLAKNMLIKQAFLKFVRDSVDSSLSILTRRIEATKSEVNEEWLSDCLSEMASVTSRKFLGIRDRTSKDLRVFHKEALLEDFAIRQEIQRAFSEGGDNISSLAQDIHIQDSVKKAVNIIDRSLLKAHTKNAKRKMIGSVFLAADQEIIRISSGYMKSGQAVRLCLNVLSAAIGKRVRRDAEKVDAAPKIPPNTWDRLLKTRKQNRFTQGTKLLRPSSQKRSLQFSATNVFSADGMTISPCPLYILEALRERMERKKSFLSDVVSYGALKKIIKESGFTDNEFESSISEMTRQDNRLIYCSVDDFSILKNGRECHEYDAHSPFHLSWSGYNYSRYLSTSLIYTEYMLASTKDISMQYPNPSVLDDSFGVSSDILDGSMTGFSNFCASMENLVRGLNVLTKDAMTRLSNPKVEIYFHSFSPTLDYFFKVSLKIFELIEFQKSHRSKASDQYEVLSGTQRDLISICYEIDVFMGKFKQASALIARQHWRSLTAKMEGSR